MVNNFDQRVSFYVKPNYPLTPFLLAFLPMFGCLFGFIAFYYSNLLIAGICLGMVLTMSLYKLLPSYKKNPLSIIQLISVLIVTETIYWCLTRYFILFQKDSLELFWNFCRLAMILTYWHCCNEPSLYIQKKLLLPKWVIITMCISIILMAMVHPPVESNSLYSIEYHYGSFLVAFREEWLFRVILLMLLTTFFVPTTAIILSAIAFALWHIGIGTRPDYGYLVITILGISFGVLWLATRSFLLIMALHFVYDTIISIPLTNTMDYNTQNNLYMLTIVFIMVVTYIGLYKISNFDKKRNYNGLI